MSRLTNKIVLTVCETDSTVTSVNQTPDHSKRLCSEFECQNTGSCDVNKDKLDKANYARNVVRATGIAAAKEVNQRN